eukprot:CFRG1130T1
MKLLTHNMIQCHVANCKSHNFPLKIVLAEENSIENEECEMNPDFIRHMLPKLEWSALKNTVDSLGLGNLPEKVPSPDNIPLETLAVLHHVLLEVDVKNCQLVCPNEECNRSYPVVQGIPNLLLTKDEV